MLSQHRKCCCKVKWMASGLRMLLLLGANHPSFVINISFISLCSGPADSRADWQFCILYPQIQTSPNRSSWTTSSPRKSIRGLQKIPNIISISCLVLVIQIIAMVDNFVNRYYLLFIFKTVNFLFIFFVQELIFGFWYNVNTNCWVTKQSKFQFGFQHHICAKSHFYLSKQLKLDSSVSFKKKKKKSPSIL